VWASRKRAGGAGLCDFDVLDGLEEFLQAGELVGLRRVSISRHAPICASMQRRDQLPGEPGVTYIMAAASDRA